MIDFERVIKSANKSGKMFFGSKKAMEAAKNGRALALIAASNCPPRIVNQIQHYAHLSNVPVHTYPSTSADLGMACGKPFAVSVVTIRDLVEPELLKMVKEPKI